MTKNSSKFSLKEDNILIHKEVREGFYPVEYVTVTEVWHLFDSDRMVSFTLEGGELVSVNFEQGDLESFDGEDIDDFIHSNNGELLNLVRGCIQVDLLNPTILGFIRQLDKCIWLWLNTVMK